MWKQHKALCPGHTRAMAMGPKGHGARAMGPWGPRAMGPMGPGGPWDPRGLLFPHKKHLPPGQNPCPRARIQGPRAPKGPTWPGVLKNHPLVLKITP